MWNSKRLMCHLYVGIAACATLLVAEAQAQSYPTKPVRMLVGLAAGGTTDIVARMVSQKLRDQLGQSVIVDNRPGASGAIANEMVATSPPDGHTLVMMGSSATILVVLRNKLPYNLERDFAPISLVGIGPYVLVVHPSVPAHSVKELIALARAQPGKLSYGSVGVGGSTHLVAELFNLMAKVNTLHVPYKGSGEAVVAVVSGQVDMSFPGLTGALPLIKAGRLRALALTSTKRMSLVPSLPTFIESGLPGYDRSAWYGVLAPAGVPKEIIARLNALIVGIVNTPEMKEAFTREGVEAQTSTPEQFAALIRDETGQNAKLVKLIGLRAE